MKIGRYRHFKGKEYEVLGVGRDCDNLKRELVIYKSLYESEEFGYGQIWARELSDFLGEKEFLEDVEIGGRKFKKGEKVRRFEYVGES